MVWVRISLGFRMIHLYLIEHLTYSLIYTAIIIGIAIATVLVLVSQTLAIHTPDPEKTSSYECGFEPFEDARNRFDVRFYIVAILFIIFDLEVAFLFPWAATITFTGIFGYMITIMFLALLTIGFIYEVVKGALNPR